MRFRVRSLMFAVGVVALFLGSMRPGRQWYRRWSYHRSQAAMFARFEGRERLNHTRELQSAADRGPIRTGLMKTPEFGARGASEQERIIDNVVAFHKERAGMALASASQWALKRRDSETAAYWCWDPFAPDVP